MNTLKSISHSFRLKMVLVSILASILASACQSKGSYLDEQRVYLYIASSLENSVRCLNQSYQKLYPHRQIVLSLLGSQTARLQIERGAPAGIFISADYKHIQSLKKQGLIAQSQRLAYNQIALFTKKQSQVLNFNELPKTKSLGIGARSVPVGHYAWSIIDAESKKDPNYRANIEKLVISQDLSARSLKARAIRTEVESIFLYQSDGQQVQASYRQVDLPKAIQDLNQVKLYIALTQTSTPQDMPHESTRAKQDWYDLMLSNLGQQCLIKQGLRVK